MMQYTHFFDPAQAHLYAQSLRGASVTYSASVCADLFYQLQQAEQTPACLSQAYTLIQQCLQDVRQRYASTIMPEYSKAKLAALPVATSQSLPDSLVSATHFSTGLQQTALVFATQPQWLQNISPAVASQTFIARQLLHVYVQLTQQKQQNTTLAQAYQAMLLASGIKFPCLHRHLSIQDEIPIEILNLATVQLAFANFPRVLLPEILGFTLAYCRVPTMMEACFPPAQLSDAFWQQRHSLLQQQVPTLLQCSADYLHLFPQHTQGLWPRMQQGFYLYQWLMQQACSQMQATLKSPLCTQQMFAKIVQHKAFAAKGHHQKVQLAGRSLEQWFAGLPDNTDAFLQALMQSDYVNREQPAKSRLLQLFAFKGPMFGVLNAAEQKLLLRWLQEGTREQATLHTLPSKVAVCHVTRNIKSSSIEFASLTTREMYYYLLNADVFPAVLPFAKARVNKLLLACKLLSPLPFAQYSHQQFDAYIKAIYQCEVANYQPLQGVPKISKAAYIWGFEQIAPLILIDGSWIQNSLALQHIAPDICDILFAIYYDEIGKGQLQQNHPYIFRQLLNSLAISLPPAHSREFIAHKGFMHSAFDMPVFMLALASFPCEFLPELLGLNMAIELSGLGKSYLRLVDDWHYWGIDPSIAKIHISIDNYASGHAFLAKKAIRIYMDDLQQRTANQAVLDNHWRRIYTGYAALRFVGGRFKLGLPLAYFLYKFKNKFGLGR